MSNNLKRIPGVVAALAWVITAAACASTPGTIAAPGTTLALPVGATGGSQRGVGLEVSSRNEGTQLTLAADPAAVFDALEATYSTLQIPLSRRDPSAGILGNEGLKMRRQLGKLELRRVFDCGGTSGMPNAETYTITASIMSSIAANSTQGSIVTTVIDASAESPTHPGSGVRCSSSGSLEGSIEKELRTRLNQRN